MASTQRKTLTLTIDLEGAAFQDGFADQEVAMLLRSAADSIESGRLQEGSEPLGLGRGVDLYDTNGNRVGYVGTSLKRSRR